MRLIPLRSIALIAILLLAACATPVEKSGGAPVRAAEIEGARLIVSDGTELPIRSWRASGPEKGIILGVHGMNDYSNAFHMIGPWLAERGYTTYAYDQRGFGAGPHRGLWAGHRTMARDFREAAGAIRAANPDKPLFVFGLSMGAATVLAAAGAEALPPVDGLVLEAPAVWGWRAMNPLYKSTLWIGAHTTPGKTLTGGRLKIWPSDNIEMLRAFSRDPLVIKGTRIDAIYGLVTLMDQGYFGAAKVDRPVLVLYGRKDEVVPERPVREAAARMNGHARLVLYDNGYHMLTRDLQAETVWTDILTFIENPKAPMPSVAGRARPVAEEAVLAPSAR